jgi:hypothetical protein
VRFERSSRDLGPCTERYAVPEIVFVMYAAIPSAYRSSTSCTTVARAGVATTQ